MDGGGADHKLHIVCDILRVVSGDDRDTMLAQIAHIGRLIHV